MRAAGTKNLANQRPPDFKVFDLPVSGCRPDMSETRTSLGQVTGHRVSLSAGTGSQGGGRTALYYRKSTRRETDSREARVICPPQALPTWFSRPGKVSQ
jgi:hypothetical protein